VRQSVLEFWADRLKSFMQFVERGESNSAEGSGAMRGVLPLMGLRCPTLDA
jgi:hypothetical protein